MEMALDPSEVLKDWIQVRSSGLSSKPCAVDAIFGFSSEPVSGGMALLFGWRRFLFLEWKSWER